MTPVEPEPSRWRFPDPHGPDDLVAVGGDLEPGTVLQAYRKGLFPMPTPDGLVGWWAPRRRGIIPLDALVVSRSLRRSTRRFVTTVDRAFPEVIEACGDPDRPYGWITPEMTAAYRRLHDLGWVHSVETWSGDGRLVGGLYGVAIGGLFAGESMFHLETDASKVALVRLVDLLAERGGRLLDVQWRTDHLATLGAVEVDRAGYRRLLVDALEVPHLRWEDEGPGGVASRP